MSASTPPWSVLIGQPESLGSWDGYLEFSSQNNLCESRRLTPWEVLCGPPELISGLSFSIDSM